MRAQDHVAELQAEVASKLSVFCSTLLADWQLGAWVPNMPRRAKWLREIFESLGPAYIKIAQALSTRVDLVPEAYLKEFAQLQDNVAPFETNEAMKLIESEYGMRLDQVCMHRALVELSIAQTEQCPSW